MTEYNYFCWSDNNKNSFQKPRYRVFNVEVSQKEYLYIKKINHKLKIDPNESYNTRFHTAFQKMWQTLSDTEKQEYFNIPHFNWTGFTFITGIQKVKEPKTKKIK